MAAENDSEVPSLVNPPKNEVTVDEEREQPKIDRITALQDAVGKKYLCIV